MSTRYLRGLAALALMASLATACAGDTGEVAADDETAGPGAGQESDRSPVADREADPSDAGGPLTAPVDVQVQIDNSDVVLRWDDPTNPDSVVYLVVRDGTELGTAEEHMYRDPGLDDGAYRYQIVARAAGGRASDPVDVIAQVGAPDLFPPSDPTGVEIQVVDGKVLITWNESLDDRGVRGYLIHRNRDFYAWVTDELKFVDDDIEPNRTYRYRVRAQDDAANNSAPVGGIVSTGPPDVTPPSAPEVLDVDVDGAVVTIDWHDSDDNREIWGYLIHRDGIFHAWVDDATEFRETVMTGSTHKYVVRAQDGAGNNSAASETIDIAVG